MDDPANEGAEPPQRKSVRSEVTAEVVLRRSGHGTYRVNLSNLSPHGCKVEFVERPFLGELVWVKFDELEALEASVCWVDGFAAGLEFRNPIHPAVFGLLLRKLAGPPGG